MANLKITFYKGYPITPESEYAPYFDTLHDTAASVYAALQDYKIIEYNITGDFTPLQDYINVQEFAEVDGCNYVRVEVLGEFTKYYYIKDIVALSQIERDGRYYRPAQVFLYEDVFLSNFYQVTPTGALKKPLVSGNLIQCNRYELLQKYMRTAPVSPRFDGVELQNAVNEYYYRFAFIATYVDNDGAVGHLAISNVTTDYFSSYAQILSGLSKVRKVIELEGVQKTFEPKADLLNLYILPEPWVLPFLYDFSGTTKSITAINTHGAELSATYLTGMDVETTGFGTPIEVATLKAKLPQNSEGRFEDLNKYFLKTSNNLISIPWSGGKMTEDNAPTVKVYMEIPNGGVYSDTINIYALIGDNLVDISNDFKIDTAVNQTALNASQNKVSTALKTITGVIGGIGGVVGGVTSGNYFGAVTAAAGGVGAVTGLFEGLNAPAKMTSNGNASAALFLYGLITLFKLVPTNEDIIKNDIYLHGYIYPEKPFLSVGYLIDNFGYLKLENAVIKGEFGTDISRELKERFERGIKFIRLEDI